MLPVVVAINVTCYVYDPYNIRYLLTERDAIIL